MQVKLIVGVSENNVIGNKNKLPWNVKSEMKYFRETTTGNSIIMGRKTFDSIGMVLPKRLTIVVTRDARLADEPEKRLLYARTVESAIKKAKQNATRFPHAFIIGGTQIYNYALENELCDELLISRIPVTVQGDTTFPPIPKLYTKVRTDEKEEFTVEVFKKNNQK